MRTVLTIGREPDNDFVINLPIVSGHHARLTWQGVDGQALLEDLGSSNGTALGQLERKIQRSTITAADTIYFGNHPVPGAELLAWVDPSMAPSLLLHGNDMVVGRDPGCHRVIDRQAVSGRHARFRRSGERITVEDLGSSNGTFVNGKPVREPTEVRFGDLISLGVDSFRLTTGSAPVASTQRLDAIKPAITPRPTPTLQVDTYNPAPISTATATATATAGPATAADWVYPVVLVALLLQAPFLAGAIGIIWGDRPPESSFLLGLAAVWIGLSAGVFGLMLDLKYPEDRSIASFWLTRAAILGAVCLGGCLLMQVVATATSSLAGSGLGSFAVLVLASWVGLAAGSVIVLVAPGRPAAFGALAAALVGLGLFGGGPWSLDRSASPIRLASNIAPSRWAFEGLLVAESDARPAPGPAGEARPTRDLAEEYFPSETDRMGPRADAMALGSMLIGLLGVGVFLVKASGSDR